MWLQSVDVVKVTCRQRSMDMSPMDNIHKSPMDSVGRVPWSMSPMDNMHKSPLDYVDRVPWTVSPMDIGQYTQESHGLCRQKSHGQRCFLSI